MNLKQGTQMAGDKLDTSYSDRNKYPLIWAVTLIVSSFWFVIYFISGVNDSSQQRYDLEKARLTEYYEGALKDLQCQYDTERQRNDKLIQALFIKNGIINGIQERIDNSVLEEGNSNKKDN